MAVDSEYTGVNHDELTKINSRISEYSTNLTSKENQILTDLSGLKNQITIDNKTIDNGVDSIKQNFNDYKTSYNDSMALFKNLSDKYVESAINAAQYMEEKFDEGDK